MKKWLSRSHLLHLPMLVCAAGLGLPAPAGAAERVPLRVFMAQFPESKLETNDFTRSVSERLGIDFRFDVTGIDPGPAKEKRQITLASSDLPDAFFLIPWVDGFSRSELLRLGSEGALLPLKGLIDRYAPNVKAALEKTPAFARLATAPDGEIYALPQWNDCYHCSYGSKLWINAAWLKKLGLAMPRTTEDLRSVLMAFKTRDPNGNGKADEIPLTGNVRDGLVPFFMNAFIYDPRFTQQYASTLALDGNRVVLQAAKDGWRDGLRYIAGLYADGLIDPASFTQTGEGMQALGNNGEAVLVGSATMLHPYALVAPNSPDGRDRAYDAVPPLTGPKGVRYATYVLPSSPQGTFAITYTASEDKQKKAMELLNYLFSPEGRTEGYFGPKGKAWRPAEAGDIALDPKLTPTYMVFPQKPGVPAPNDKWSAVAQYYFPAEVRNAEATPMDIYSPEGYERRLFEATKLYDGLAPMDQVLPTWNIWFGNDVASELAQLETNINDYVNRTNAEFITGQRNIADDAAWKDYLQGLQDLGLDRYIALMQAAYDASPK